MKHSDGGKGSTQRPNFIGFDEYAKNYDRIFGKEPQKSCGKCKDCSCNKEKTSSTEDK